MSFYDDASLVFLPSGGAGKDGKAYSIKPVPEYGTNLVTNGGFDTDTDWVKGAGWTISGGTANCDGTQTTNSLFYQNLGDLSNKTIRMTFTISGYGGGQLSTAFFGASGTQVEDITANGTYTFNIDVQSGHNGNSGFTANSSFIGSIDNVSFREVVVDGDFTFSRGSNLTATRVDSNGLIEKGRENLLLYSNGFNNWTNSNTSETSGQSGYDGSSDAWLLTKTAASGFIFRSFSGSGVQTFSAYVKANASTWGLLQCIGGSNPYAYFDLGTGVVGSIGGGTISNSIEDVGGGWYRISLIHNTTISSARIYPAEANTALGTSGSIYIQDAQLEQGLVATEYIESGATTGLAGILEDSPRFDYSGGASCPSLLLEPSRTQLAKLSEYFEGWSDLVNITPTTNYTTSPEGLQNATRLQFTSNGYMYNTGAPTQVSGTEYTLTLYAKRNDSGTQSFGFFTNGSGSVDSAMALTSEWQRFTYTYTASNNSQLGLAGLSGADVSVYGFQVEQGSYPTSYIPNHSGGSVTRSKDSCSGAGDASTFNDSEGVLYAEIAALAEDSDSKRITISDGTLANRITISISSNIISGFVNVNNVTEYTFYESGQDVINPIKIAVKYKTNDFALWINGTKYDVSTSGTTFPASTLSDLSFNNATGINNLFGNVKQVIYFPTALSTTDCEILTGATSYESFSAMATALNYTTYE